jgi:hypothetical protein
MYAEKFEHLIYIYNIQYVTILFPCCSRLCILIVSSMYAVPSFIFFSVAERL